MEFLLAFFGFFALLSVVALIKLQGNPIFLFTLVLCVAGLVTTWRLEREDAAGGRAPFRAPSRRRTLRRRR
jgi:hypothetical protein